MMPAQAAVSCKRKKKESINVMHALVSVVDDDESVRESLPELLRSFGFEVRPFSSAEEFLESDSLVRTDCLVLDVMMPGMTGFELHQELARRKHRIPVVFITAQADESLRQRSLLAGAAACLLKPFSELAILGAVNAALEKSKQPMGNLNQPE